MTIIQEPIQMLCPYCKSPVFVDEGEQEGYPTTVVKCANQECSVQPFSCRDGSGCTDLAIADFSAGVYIGWFGKEAPVTKGSIEDN